MGAVHMFAVSLEHVECSCGGVYAISKRIMDLARERGGSWHCPYCQGLVSFNETEVKRLQKELEAERARKQAALERANRLNEELGKTEIQLKRTKTILKNHKTRTANGVCPCCNRAFVQLQRHMETKHPDYVEKA
jgi:ssDNA-binding Zn-finger/Zn-ribbon topoisomerase 1